MGNFILNVSVAVAYNGIELCVRWGFQALKPNSSTNFNLSTND